MVSVEVRPFDESLVPAFEKLLRSDQASHGCWCTWFIIPVAQYHSGGDAGNRKVFESLLEAADQPVGLAALADGEMVGWCAVGPRSRYTRAIKTPTYGRRESSEDTNVWLVPCFLIRPDVRNLGIARKLLEAAVATARKQGATAIEAFPMAGSGRKSGRDIQVGVEPMFSAVGFEPLHRPSANRVMMRLELD